MLKAAQTKQDVLQLVVQEISTILQEKAIDVAALTEATALADVSLSSLDFAELVSNLEAEYEVDPFEELVPITSIVTVGDLVSAYFQCLSGDTVSSQGENLNDELKALKAKAQ